MPTRPSAASRRSCAGTQPGLDRGPDSAGGCLDYRRDRRGDARHPAVTGQVFLAMAEAGIEVLAIAQGSSELNLSFVIDSAQEDAAVRCIHAHFRLGAVSTSM